MIKGRTIRLGSALMVSAILACLAPSVASAEVQSSGGLKYVTKTKNNFQGYDQIQAKCPRGLHVIGGGQSNDAGYSELRTHHSFPIDKGDSDKRPDDAWAVNLESFDPHDIVIYAICVDIPVQYRKKLFSPPGLAEQSGALTVGCPGSSHILGGGQDGNVLVYENSSFPSAGSDGWTVYVDSVYTGNKKTKVFAICGKPNTSIQVGSNAVNQNQQDFADAICPVGKPLYSGGQSNSGTWNQASVNSSFPKSSSSQTGVPDDFWRAYVDNPATGTRSIFAYAVCGPKLN